MSDFVVFTFQLLFSERTPLEYDVQMVFGLIINFFAFMFDLEIDCIFKKVTMAGYQLYLPRNTRLARNKPGMLCYFSPEYDHRSILKAERYSRSLLRLLQQASRSKLLRCSLFYEKSVDRLLSRNLQKI